MNSNLSQFYSMESLLGVIGIFPLLINLFKLDTPNPLEEKLKWIFSNLTLLFLVRIPYQAFQNETSARLTYAVATILMLNVFLYFETLLRRHMPYFLKILVSIFTVIFLIDTLFLNFIHEQSHLLFFGLFALFLQSSILFLALSRNKKEYSKSENALISINLVSLFLLVLFFLSDVKVFHEYIKLPHCGVLGSLLFTYASFHDQSIMKKNFTYLIKILKMVLFSSLLAVIILLALKEYTSLFALHLFIFFMLINLIFRIHYLASELKGTHNIYKLIDHVVESDKKSLMNFLKDMQSFFKKVDIKMLNEDDWRDYDQHLIISYFIRNKTHLISLFDLRNALIEDEKNDLDIIEQMIDLLEKNEMSHLCLINSENSIFVIFNFHMIGQSNLIYSQTALISEFSHLFDKKSLK